MICVKVTFKPIDFYDHKNCQLLTKWANDSALNHLLIPNNTSEPKKVDLQFFINYEVNNTNYHENYFILVDNNIVGEVSFSLNPSFLYNKTIDSAWISICIADNHYCGIGVGKQAIHFIEQRVKANNISRIELGVFSFNTVATAFYKKLGYKAIGSIDNFTYHNNNWHKDIRMEKVLF